MTPVRLNAPVENKTIIERIDTFALTHANIFLPLSILIFLILFVVLCYALVGFSAVESGTYYYHLDGGIL